MLADRAKSKIERLECFLTEMHTCKMNLGIFNQMHEEDIKASIDVGKKNDELERMAR